MKTNFFTSIEPMLSDGLQFTFTVKADEHGKLIVSTRPMSNGIKDKGFNNLHPLILNHSASELDQGFFETIQQPVVAYKDHAEQVKSYEESIKLAASKARAGSKSNAKEVSSADKATKDKAIATESLKEAKILIDQEKHEQALARLNKAFELDGSLEEVKTLIQQTKEVLTKPICERASALLKGFKYKDAIEEIRALAQIDPTNECIKRVEEKIKEQVGEKVFKTLKG